MLNLSKERIDGRFNARDYDAFRTTMSLSTSGYRRYVILALLLLFMVIMFLPWTQNIRSNGQVIALQPQNRPQSVQSVIDGRLEHWYVQEGQSVTKGDTIAHISEVKYEFMDADLIPRTKEQVNSISDGADAYKNKVAALEQQAEALNANLKILLDNLQLQLNQAGLKVQEDSVELELATNNFNIADVQLERADSLYTLGIKSLTSLEASKVKYQDALTKQQAARLKLNNSKLQYEIKQLDIEEVRAEYADKLAKNLADQFETKSLYSKTRSELAKLQNQLSNYTTRQDNYFITAPQNGIITQVIQSGIGEIIKSGTELLTIMPISSDLAVEAYVRPMDLPLIKSGTPVRIQFDGWPAVVFSGWPNSSTGTFGGTVLAIDNFASDNNLYRVLVKPDDILKPWPELLRVGSGADVIILLEEVPIWYEIWRQLNGFPAEFYNSVDGQRYNSKTPTKSIE